jgi:purine-binding chemotaxis protein CheW
MGQYLTFQLRTELFGIPIGDVREINQHGEVTPVPHSPESVKGVMNLRGKIIPVVNLRVKFGMVEEAITKESCIIVIDTLSGQVGIIVDSVKEVIDLNAEQISEPPGLTSANTGSLVQGVGKLENQVVLLVDVKSAFVSDRLEEMQEAA